MHQKDLREPNTGMKTPSEDDKCPVTLLCDGEAQGLGNMNEKEERDKKGKEELTRKIEIIATMWVVWVLSCIIFIIGILIYFEPYIDCVASILLMSNLSFLFLVARVLTKAPRAEIPKYGLCVWILVIVILALHVILAACSFDCP